VLADVQVSERAVFLSLQRAPLRSVRGVRRVGRAQQKRKHATGAAHRPEAVCGTSWEGRSPGRVAGHQRGHDTSRVHLLGAGTASLTSSDVREGPCGNRPTAAPSAAASASRLNPTPVSCAVSDCASPFTKRAARCCCLEAAASSIGAAAAARFLWVAIRTSRSAPSLRCVRHCVRRKASPPPPPKP
jgi:hypothetical protein